MNHTSSGVRLHFEKIHVSFGSAYQLQLNQLTVPAGKITALLGPSGCGKSTLLNLAAGYLSAQEGVVYHDATPLQGPAPHTAFLFQQRNLFPWMTAQKNISFALENKGVSPTNAKNTALLLLETMGLQDYAQHYPNELSGGMQQRVVLARAFAVQPRLFLMDEPFSALDSHTKQQMYTHTLKAWENLGATFLIVTHDVEEALALAHKIVVMRRYPAPGIGETLNLNQSQPGRLSLAQKQDFIQSIYQVIQSS